MNQTIVKKKILCSEEKGFVIWAKTNSRSSATKFGWIKCSVGHNIPYPYIPGYKSSGNKSIGDEIWGQNEKPLFISPCSAQSHSIPLDCLLNGPNLIWLTEERWSSDPSWLGIYPKLLANQRMATYCDYLISTGLISFISYWGSLCLFWQEHDGNLVHTWGIQNYFIWCVIYVKN